MVQKKKGQEGEKKENKNFLSCFRRKTKNGRKKNVDFKKKEIEDLVSLYTQRKKEKSKIPNDFKVEEKKDTFNERIKLREKIFRISIGRESSNFIAFISSLTIVFKYLLSAARVTVNNENDYVRFIFSHAPARYFSTCVLPLKEFNVDFF